MKLAIVHDDLMRRGGAEQVALCFHEAFPEVPIFTLAYQYNKTYPQFKNSHVITSWFQKIARNELLMKWLFFPLGIMAMMSHRIKAYDVILMSTTYCAKYIRARNDAMIICYCHQPFRLAWYPESYPLYKNANFITKLILNTILYVLRKIDFHYAQKVNIFIANSDDTRVKISKCYNIPSKQVLLLKPPVDCSKFYVSDESNDKKYFLVVSRLEFYKRVDLVIEVFNQLNLPLVIVGNGMQATELKKMANANIRFESNIDSQILAKLYSECEALIFPQKEDYGITALEANASGRPVIAFGEGGILETTIPFVKKGDFFTSILFKAQTVKDLTDAIIKFEDLKNLIEPLAIRNHAENFDKKLFISNIQGLILKQKSPVLL